jgi:hypothetical protein
MEFKKINNSTLHNGLAEIQRNLKATKNQFNNFGKYKYRSCEDILEALKPHLKGFTLIISDEILLIGDRYYIKATAVISDGKEKIIATGIAREPQNKKGMDESQITGATSSYARKYALNGLFCIDDNKDADFTNTHQNNEEKQPKKIAVDFKNENKEIEEIDKIKNKIGLSELIKNNNFSERSKAYAREKFKTLS